MNYSVCSSHTFFSERKIGINRGKNNKEQSVTKQCYATHFSKSEQKGYETINKHPQ